MRIAVYPGSFDPITLGHLNIVRRAAKLFDKVYVCVMVNSGKKPWFTLEERMDFIRRCTERFGNVEVDFWEGLLVEYCKTRGINVIVRGLRAVTDFEAEFQMAVTNSHLEPEIETVFLTASEKYTYLSSTIVREMIRYNADLGQFVPREIKDEIVNKLQNRR